MGVLQENDQPVTGAPGLDSTAPGSHVVALTQADPFHHFSVVRFRMATLTAATPMLSVALPVNVAPLRGSTWLLVGTVTVASGAGLRVPFLPKAGDLGSVVMM